MLALYFFIDFSLFLLQDKKDQIRRVPTITEPV